MTPGRAARSRIRVAYCLDSFEIGGTELNAVRTAEQLDRARFDVTMICLSSRGPLRERCEQAGLRVVEMPISGLLSLATLRQGRRLAEFLRRERFDIVHAHDIYTNVFVVPWARVARVPVVIASRRWWSEVNRGAQRTANRLSYRFAHRVLANSPSVAQMLVGEEGVPASKVVMIPNFVDEAAFLPPSAEELGAMRASFGLGGDAEVVGIVANLHAIKDHRTLFEATSRLARERPALRLVVVGDGAERSKLTELANQLAIADRVIFAGRRPHMPSPHWAFDLSVLSSRGEGFPNSLVEAMAAGRAVVATRVGGVADAVIDGETGLLVGPGNAPAFAGAMSILLADPARRKLLGAAGARSARARFHAELVVGDLQDQYERLLGTLGRS